MYVCYCFKMVIFWRSAVSLMHGSNREMNGFFQIYVIYCAHCITLASALCRSPSTPPSSIPLQHSLSGMCTRRLKWIARAWVRACTVQARDHSSASLCIRRYINVFAQIYKIHSVAGPIGIPLVHRRFVVSHWTAASPVSRKGTVAKVNGESD